MTRKLVFINNLYPPFSVGGYEENCLDMVETIRAYGHTVLVLTSDYGGIRVPSDPPYVSRTLRVKPNFNKARKSRTPSVLLRGLLVEMHNVRTIARCLSTADPDAVFVWNCGYLGRAMFAVIKRVSRVVYVVHDTWMEPLLSPVIRRGARNSGGSYAKSVYRTALRLVGCRLKIRPGRDFFVFNSESLLNEYLSHGAEVRSPTVVRNGIRSDLFRFRRQRLLESQVGTPRRILFAGRVAPYKGVTTLVKALRLVCDVPGLEQTGLTLLGATQDEAYGRQLRVLIKTLGLQEAVTFLARRRRSEIPAIYGEHDCFAFPSEWEEPFGLTLLEAMATGLPVVASYCGAPRAIIRAGLNGLSFRPGDATELANKLAWLLTHPAEAAAMGQRASQEVQDGYTLDAEAKAILACGEPTSLTATPAVPILRTE